PAVAARTAAEPQADVVEVEQLSSMRKTIARRLTEAWQAPVFQLGVTVDMERAQAVRAKLVALHTDGAKPTLSDLLTKICAAALMRHRAVNALYKGDAIERFTAVLNPPQAAILAVGSVEDTVVAVDAEPAVRPRMEITLTCDHRAVDGATGAQFLTTVKQFLEEPGLAL